MSNSNSYALALSGGGARGMAHIGAIKAFEEKGIKIKAISGASAGSIVGYFLACGLESSRMIDIAKKTNFYSAFKVSFSKTGIVSIGNIRNILKKEVGIDSYENLDIPLHIGVTNLKSGECDYLNSGNVYDAIVASSSIPLIFNPVDINGNLYVDGGLSANLPVKPLLNSGYPLIGINVVGYGKGKKPDSYAQLIDRTIDIVAWHNTKESLEKCDIQITPEKTNDFGTFEFKKVDELVEVGYEETIRTLENVDTVKKKSA